MQKQIFSGILAASAFLAPVSAMAQSTTAPLPVDIKTRLVAPQKGTHCDIPISSADGKITARADYVAIQGTVPRSCVVSPSLLEYVGRAHDSMVAIDTLWKAGDNGPVADDTYRMTTVTAINPLTSKATAKRVWIKLNDEYLNIKSDNIPGNPTLVELIDQAGNVLTAKSCDMVNIAAGTMHCTQNIDPWMTNPPAALAFEAARGQDDALYVQAMAAVGRPMSNKYYNPDTAQARKNIAAQLFAAAAAAPTTAP